MDKTQFIQGIQAKRTAWIESDVDALIEPPGRQPCEKDKKISEFYNKLEIEDQKTIQDIVKNSVNGTIFSFLCILDHVSFIENSPDKTEFELYATKDGKRVLINNENEEMLHELFNDWANED